MQPGDLAGCCTRMYRPEERPTRAQETCGPSAGTTCKETPPFPSSMQGALVPTTPSNSYQACCTATTAPAAKGICDPSVFTVAKARGRDHHPPVAAYSRGGWEYPLTGTYHTPLTNAKVQQEWARARLPCLLVAVVEFQGHHAAQAHTYTQQGVHTHTDGRNPKQGTPEQQSQCSRPCPAGDLSATTWAGPAAQARNHTTQRFQLLGRHKKLLGILIQQGTRVPGQGNLLGGDPSWRHDAVHLQLVAAPTAAPVHLVWEQGVGSCCWLEAPVWSKAGAG
jgi:hypothetical protein